MHYAWDKHEKRLQKINNIPVHAIQIVLIHRRALWIVKEHAYAPYTPMSGIH